MYIFLFLLWMIFNAKITLEIILFGLVIAAAVYAFMCKFMDFSIQKDILMIRKSGIFFLYVVTLVWEILKANKATIRMILSNRYEIEPVIVRFKTTLKSKTARVLFANSITLTPGTITVEFNDDEYVVHCLDKDFSEGISEGRIVDLLHRLEAL